MLAFPKFKSKYVVRYVSGEGIFLLSENGHFLLQGHDVEVVGPYLTGQFTREQIAAQLGSWLPTQRTLATISLLEQQGHLESNGLPAFQPGLAAFWSEIGADLSSLHGLPERVRPGIRAVGEVDASAMAQLLFSLNFRQHGEENFLFVICDDYQNPALDGINRECIQRNIPWMLIKPIGTNIWIGPILSAPRTACWQCLATRLQRNREIENYIHRRTGESTPIVTSRARVSFLENQAYEIAITQFLRFLAHGTNQSLESRILVVETINLNFSFHAIIKRPQCLACGIPERFSGNETHIDLVDLPTGSVTDGGVRVRTPEETFATYAHHVSPISGVVSGVHASSRVGPMQIFVAGHNFALKNDQLYFLRDSLRINSAGKGKTEAQAKASALCEALERYSGLFTGEETRIRASYHRLGRSGIHPNDCMLFSEKQYLDREQWLARGSRFQIVPLPFDEKAEMEWSPIREFRSGEVRYLPTSYIYYGYPDNDNRFYAWADSNGCAAGSSVADAILQATLELVERDAVAIWWYNRIQRPAFDLQSLHDPFIDELRSFYKSIGREFWVLDLTNDSGIPSFAAVTRRMNSPSEDIIMGFGAHLDPEIAVGRALSEMNQFMPAVLETMSDGSTNYHFGDADALRWWKNARLDSERYLIPMSQDCTTSVNSYPRWKTATILEQVHECFNRIEALGLKILIVNQSRPDIGLPVFKVIVPGLRHFWARFAPGRLYSVPVKLGWIDHPRSEDELNPTAMFV